MAIGGPTSMARLATPMKIKRQAFRRIATEGSLSLTLIAGCPSVLSLQSLVRSPEPLTCDGMGGRQARRHAERE